MRFYNPSVFKKHYLDLTREDSIQLFDTFFMKTFFIQRRFNPDDIWGKVRTEAREEWEVFKKSGKRCIRYPFYFKIKRAYKLIEELESCVNI